MTRQNPYTKAAIKRAIEAALAAGLAVVGVRPDGTVLTEKPGNNSCTTKERLTGQPKLRDAREKLGVC